MHGSQPPGSIERLAQIALIALLLTGCWLVLRPFFTAIMFAAVVGVSTWSAYEWLQHRLGVRIEFASVVACLAVLLLAVAPLVLLLTSLTDGMRLAAAAMEPWLRGEHVPAPAWLDDVPLVGAELRDWWQNTAGHRSRAGELLRYFAQPARNLALASGRHVGNALLQITLVVFLLYFVYRYGAAVAEQIGRAAERAGGAFARELLATARRSVVGVMYGVVGAGLAQAMIATLGFAIAGLPNPFLLGALTFVLSMVAFGPPVLWIGAAVWLFRSGDTGWAVFMIAYGFLAISSVDNLLKPLLISRASRIPFAVTLMGVVGGLIAFGLMGVFLGPALLAVAGSMTRHWLDFAASGHPAQSSDDTAEPPQPGRSPGT